jgi:hypothetical protein
MKKRWLCSSELCRKTNAENVHTCLGCGKPREKPENDDVQKRHNEKIAKEGISYADES